MAGERNQTEENNENGDQNNWWKSWYSTAVSKSGEVLDFLKQDLTEISSTVKTEAASLINNTTSAITEGIQIGNPEWSSATSSVKESVSSIINQVSNALNPPPIDDDEEPYLVENNRLVSISKFQSKLYLLSADPNTYLSDIEEDLFVRYNAWLDSLKNYEVDQLSNETLTKLLLSNTRLKENYEKLVPEKVSHGDFWNRYLFRKALLEDEEAETQRRKILEKKVCDSLEWEKESFGSHLSLSEEEQGHLLREYENERSSVTKLGCENKDDNPKEPATGVNNGSEESSVQSVNDRESSSDDWEKDFDMEEIA